MLFEALRYWKCREIMSEGVMIGQNGYFIKVSHLQIRRHAGCDETQLLAIAGEPIRKDSLFDQGRRLRGIFIMVVQQAIFRVRRFCLFRSDMMAARKGVLKASRSKDSNNRK